MRTSAFLLPLVALVAARHTFVARDTDTGLSSLTLDGPASIPEQWTTPPLNPALASFSIETAFFEEYLGNVSYPNTLSLNLFQSLKERAGVAPQIRIGGITADSTTWNPNQDAALYNYIDASGRLINTTLGPQFWSSVKLLPEGTQIIMTLVSQVTKLAMNQLQNRTGLGKPQLHRCIEYGGGCLDRSWTRHHLSLRKLVSFSLLIAVLTCVP